MLHPWTDVGWSAGCRWPVLRLPGRWPGTRSPTRLPRPSQDGGWRGLLDSAYGRVLDVKVLLFLGLVTLGALNRYRIIPAATRQSPTKPHRDAAEAEQSQAAADHRRAEQLGVLRRNVRGEVALAACVLAATALLSQLPPGKFVSARPPPDRHRRPASRSRATTTPPRCGWCSPSHRARPAPTPSPPR
jgi:hypothetical protein